MRADESCHVISHERKSKQKSKCIIKTRDDCVHSGIVYRSERLDGRVHSVAFGGICSDMWMCIEV